MSSCIVAETTCGESLLIDVLPMKNFVETYGIQRYQGSVRIDQSYALTSVALMIDGHMRHQQLFLEPKVFELPPSQVLPGGVVEQWSLHLAMCDPCSGGYLG